MTLQRAAAAAIIVSAATVLAAQAPPPIALNELKLPSGFKIDVFAEGVTSARQMPDGSLLITDDQGGRILRVS